MRLQDVLGSGRRRLLHCCCIHQDVNRLQHPHKKKHQDPAAVSSIVCLKQQQWRQHLCATFFRGLMPVVMFLRLISYVVHSNTITAVGLNNHGLYSVVQHQAAVICFTAKEQMPSYILI